MTGAAAEPMRGRLPLSQPLSLGPRAEVAIGILYVVGAALTLTRVDPTRRGREAVA